MTQQQAIQHQAELAKHYHLGWWYGTRCRKCCGVFPKIVTDSSALNRGCYYECEVCGRKTGWSEMPWIAEERWNAGETTVPVQQMSLFDYLEVE